MTTPRSQAVLRLSSLGAALGAAAVLYRVRRAAVACAALRRAAAAPGPGRTSNRPLRAGLGTCRQRLCRSADRPARADRRGMGAAADAGRSAATAAVWRGHLDRWLLGVGRPLVLERRAAGRRRRARDYQWVQPYYEHRADVVVFVPGFWCAPERHFIPPAPGLSISIAIAAPGVRIRPSADGPARRVRAAAPGLARRHHRAGADRYPAAPWW